MANDFSQDPGCKALWRFEAGALAVDDKGTNNLTAIGNPVADPSDYQEGSSSVVLNSANGNYFILPDANAADGLPFKSNDAVKLLTFSFYIKLSSAPTANASILSKWSPNSSFAFYINSSRALRIIYKTSLGYDFQDVFTLSLNTWYQIIVCLNGNNGQCTVYWWQVGTTPDDSPNTWTRTFQSGRPLLLNDDDYVIGGNQLGAYLPAKLDECVLFNYFISPGEAVSIRQQAYPPLPVVEVDQAGVAVLYQLAPKVEVDQAGAVVLYQPAPMVEVDQAGVVIVYSTVPAHLPPDRAMCLTTCREIPPAPDGSLSLTMAEGIHLPTPVACRSLIRNSNLSRTNPADTLSKTLSPGPPTYAGLFLMF
jgi:hypothetical protein